MPKEEKKDMLSSKENIGNVQDKRVYPQRYVENVVDNDIKQKEQRDRHTKSEQAEQNRKVGIDEEENNKKLINNEISEEAAYRVFNKEPREKQLKEQEEQEGAAAKKFAEQKIDTGESGILEQEEVLDTFDLMFGNMEKVLVYLRGEDLEKAREFDSKMKIFAEAVFNRRIIMSEEQTKTFIAFGEHNEVVDEASAKDYIDFAFTKVLPFVAAVAGISLRLERPLSVLNEFNNLLSAGTQVSKIDKFGDLGGNLLR